MPPPSSKIDLGPPNFEQEGSQGAILFFVLELVPALPYKVVACFQALPLEVRGMASTIALFILGMSCCLASPHPCYPFTYCLHRRSPNLGPPSPGLTLHPLQVLLDLLEFGLLFATMPFCSLLAFVSQLVAPLSSIGLAARLGQTS